MLSLSPSSFHRLFGAATDSSMGNALTQKEQSLVFYWSLIAIDTSAILMNSLVLVMFVSFRRKLLTCSHNRVLFSMALGDAFVGVFGNNLGLTLLMKKPIIFYKLLGNVPLFSCLFVSVLSLVLLTADRLVAMTKPYIYISPSYKKSVFRLIVITWMVPAIIIIQQTCIYIEDGSLELKVRGYIFTVFFVTGSTALVVSNTALFFGLRSYAARLQRKSAHPGSMSCQENFTQFTSADRHCAASFVWKSEESMVQSGQHDRIQNNDKTASQIARKASTTDPELQTASEDKEQFKQASTQPQDKFDLDRGRRDVNKRQSTEVNSGPGFQGQQSSILKVKNDSDQGRSVRGSTLKISRRGGRRKSNELKKTSLVCILAVSAFMVLWLPLAVYRFCFAVGIEWRVPWLRRLALCMTITNSLLNPFIYLLVRKEFRLYLKKMFARCCRRLWLCKENYIYSVLYYIISYYIILYYIILYYIILYHIISYYIILHHIILYYIISYYIIYYMMLYDFVFCYIILCHAI